MEKRGWGGFGGYSRRRHLRRKKGNNFRVSKVNLSFGNLKFFKWSKNLTLGPILSKKSPQMPPNPLQGWLVYGNVTKVSF